MTSLPSTNIASAPSEIARPKLDHPMGIKTILTFFAIMALGLFFTAYSIRKDLIAAGTPVISYLPFLLLGVALLIALGFEFVNGSTTPPMRSQPSSTPTRWRRRSRVVWSSSFNFLGVLFSTGAVAFGIVSLLPVELIMQVGSEAGFAMVFAMLIAAIIWNLGTWWLGLPASSSHTLIGSHRRRRRQRAHARAYRESID
jgi:PiT family inorganic phosphate transporter